MLIFFSKMLKIAQTLCLVFSIFLISFTTQARADIPSYQLDQDKHLVVNYLYRFMSEPGEQNFNSIKSLDSKEWQNIQLTNSDLLLMGGENWFAFEVSNNTGDTKKIYLEVANQVRMNGAELFFHNNRQEVVQKKLELQRNNNLIVASDIEPYSQQVLYLKINSSTQLRSFMKLYLAKSYIESSNLLQLQQGVSIGGLLCIFIALLLLFFATGYKSMLILSGYFLSNVFMLSALLGLNLYYFFPHLPELIGIELPLLTAMSAIFLLIFTVQFFNLKNKLKNIYHVIFICICCLLLYIPISMLLSITININITMCLYALVIFSLIALGFYLQKNSFRLALLFTLVMGIQFLSVLIVIVSVNWFDIGFVSYRSQFYGLLFWLNCLLITFILSRQYNYHLVDKQEAQRLALTNAKASEHAQKELLKLQSQSQEELENRVQERTLELNIALQELEEVNHELEQKNTLDELTGLYNRRFYDQKILAEYRRSKRNLTPLSLVLIDIDHFKAVNDTYGHLAGDYCLEWVSKEIKQSLKRSSDLAFRYGGEEFCLILPDTDGKGAVALAENLRENISKQPCLFKDTPIPLTISNGIFTYLQQNDVMPEQIFARADKALYQAKNNGRNQTQENTDNFE